MSLAAALGLFALVQANAWTTMNPVHTVVSSLVYAPGGSVLFPAAAALVAVAAGTWSASLWRVGMRAAALAAQVGVLGLALLALFPTDPPHVGAMSFAGQVHRYAALIMFVALPVAGALATRGVPGRWSVTMRWLIAAAVIAGAVAIGGLVSGSLPASWQAPWEFAHSVRGIVERFQLLIVMTTVAVGGVLAHQSSLKPANRPSAEGAATFRGLVPRQTVGLTPLRSAASVETMVK